MGQTLPGGWSGGRHRRTEVYAAPTTPHARQRTDCSGPACRSCPTCVGPPGYPLNVGLCRAAGRSGTSGPGVGLLEPMTGPDTLGSPSKSVEARSSAPNLDIYVLTRNRSLRTIERFLDVL